MSEKSTQRVRQVADLIQRQLAASMKKAVNDPRLASISITGVVVSADLGQAKVFFSLLDTTEVPIALQALEKAKGYLRHLLATETKLRYVPHLTFIYDHSIQHGADIADLIHQAEEADNRLKKISDDNKDNKT